MKLKIQRQCRRCHRTVEFEVDKFDWMEYSLDNGERKPIQDIFPYLDPGQHAILISGICNNCFDTMYKEG